MIHHENLHMELEKERTEIKEFSYIPQINALLLIIWLSIGTPCASLNKLGEKKGEKQWVLK